MDTNQRLAQLKEKAQAGSISEDEYVEYLRLAVGRDEATARRMYRTSYAAQHTPDYGKTIVY